jgi:hypothetical protein
VRFWFSRYQRRTRGAQKPVKPLTMNAFADPYGRV